MTLRKEFARPVGAIVIGGGMVGAGDVALPLSQPLMAVETKTVAKITVFLINFLAPFRNHVSRHRLIFLRPSFSKTVGDQLMKT